MSSLCHRVIFVSPRDGLKHVWRHALWRSTIKKILSRMTQGLFPTSPTYIEAMSEATPPAFLRQRNIRPTVASTSTPTQPIRMNPGAAEALRLCEEVQRANPNLSADMAMRVVLETRSLGATPGKWLLDPKPRKAAAAVATADTEHSPLLR